MPTPSPIYGWDLPTLSEVADAPAAFAAFSGDVEATLQASGITTYLPSWTADGGVQPVSPATRTGVYRIDKKTCWFQAQLTFGASTGGGQGPLRVGLPVTARSGQGMQLAQCRLAWPNTLWNGIAEIRDGEGSALPTFTNSAQDARAGYWQSVAVGSTGPESGIPYPADLVHNVRNGGYIVVSGHYLVA